MSRSSILVCAISLVLFVLAIALGQPMLAVVALALDVAYAALSSSRKP